jgi:hypothetical protein
MWRASLLIEWLGKRICNHSGIATKGIWQPWDAPLVLSRWGLFDFLAWVLWLVVHILYLIGFRNRFLVLFQWAWAYMTYQRSARLITGEPTAALPTAPEPAPTKSTVGASSTSSVRPADIAREAAGRTVGEAANSTREGLRQGKSAD